MERGRAETARPDHAAVARRRNILFFVLADLGVVTFVLVPGLIYLFVADNGLSHRDMMLYVGGLLALQVAATGLLIWKFRIIPGPPTDGQDAR